MPISEKVITLFNNFKHISVIDGRFTDEERFAWNKEQLTSEEHNLLRFLRYGLATLDQVNKVHDQEGGPEKLAAITHQFATSIMYKTRLLVGDALTFEDAILIYDQKGGPEKLAAITDCRVDDLLSLRIGNREGELWKNQLWYKHINPKAFIARYDSNPKVFIENLDKYHACFRRRGESKEDINFLGFFKNFLTEMLGGQVIEALFGKLPGGGGLGKDIARFLTNKDILDASATTASTWKASHPDSFDWKGARQLSSTTTPVQRRSSFAVRLSHMSMGGTPPQ